jgi:hypothetical protein
MNIEVYVDNNIWDLLFKFQDDFDLATELPRNEFKISIIPEVEFEEDCIKDSNKKAFISETIAKCNIKTDFTFGFSDPKHLDRQSVTGFGDKPARWESCEERDFKKQHPVKTHTKQRPSGRHKDEGDRALAARAWRGVILTCEGPDKTGPLKAAFGRGGKIIHLDRCTNPAGISLRERIIAAYASAAP